MRFVCCAAKPQRAIGADHGRAGIFARGDTYSLIAPVSESNFPIFPASVSVNQIISQVIGNQVRMVPGVRSGHLEKFPLLSYQDRSAQCAPSTAEATQTFPFGSIAASLGIAPGTGTSHVRIVPVNSTAIAAGGGVNLRAAALHSLPCPGAPSRCAPIPTRRSLPKRAIHRIRHEDLECESAPARRYEVREGSARPSPANRIWAPRDRRALGVHHFAAERARFFFRRFWAFARAPRARAAGQHYTKKIAKV